jgi:toxin-antitoxin system PIN domain toxin
VIIPDVNILLYASFSSYPRHERALQWWEGAVNSSAEIGLTPVTIFGFVRIATNPRILTPPLSAEMAADFVELWLSQPNISHVVPGPRHVPIVLELLRGVGTGANLTTDAQIAAFAIEHSGEVYSSDTDFARFPELRWVDPLA